MDMGAQRVGGGVYNLVGQAELQRGVMSSVFRDILPICSNTFCKQGHPLDTSAKISFFVAACALQGATIPACWMLTPGDLIEVGDGGKLGPQYRKLHVHPSNVRGAGYGGGALWAGPRWLGRLFRGRGWLVSLRRMRGKKGAPLYADRVPPLPVLRGVFVAAPGGGESGGAGGEASERRRGADPETGHAEQEGVALFERLHSSDCTSHKRAAELLLEHFARCVVELLSFYVAHYKVQYLLHRRYNILLHRQYNTNTLL